MSAFIAARIYTRPSKTWQGPLVVGAMPDMAGQPAAPIGPRASTVLLPGRHPSDRRVEAGAGASVGRATHVVRQDGRAASSRRSTRTPSRNGVP